MPSVKLEEKRNKNNKTLVKTSEDFIDKEQKITNTTDKKVINILHQKGSLTRSELVKITGIARSTLYDSLTRLTIKGKVTKYSNKSPGPGRPKVFFKLTEQ
jgi:predicted ArsR family transcriptional regulator